MSERGWGWITGSGFIALLWLGAVLAGIKDLFLAGVAGVGVFGLLMVIGAICNKQGGHDG